MKLLIPGPVDVREDVLEQLSKPLISHRGKEISSLQNNIISKLKIVMGTKRNNKYGYTYIFLFNMYKIAK